jgi:hypothetical protein
VVAVTGPADVGSWDELCAGLPDHATEVMASATFTPSVAVQSKTHGAPSPPVDLGPKPGTVTG